MKITNQAAIVEVFKRYVAQTDVPEANEGRKFIMEFLTGTVEEQVQKIGGLYEFASVLLALDPVISQATFETSVLIFGKIQGLRQEVFEEADAQQEAATV